MREVKKVEKNQPQIRKEQWENLSDKVRGMLLGTIMGDSSLGIGKGYANARLSFRHSVTQTEFFN